MTILSRFRQIYVPIKSLENITYVSLFHFRVKKKIRNVKTGVIHVLKKGKKKEEMTNKE